MTVLKTKIVATLGPASARDDVVGRFIDSGVRVFRFNMSHGRREDHSAGLAIVRAQADARGVPVATLADLCGPKVRTGPMEDGSEIAAGENCTIRADSTRGDARSFGTNYPGLVDEVSPGHRVLIDDGEIRLVAERRTSEGLVCRCEAGGVIGSRKGINVPDSDLSLASLGPKDREDLAWAVENKLDFVALSFVRHPDDVRMLRQALDELGAETPIVAKIETPQAINVLDEIIEASDVILVARGDLGVEMDVSRIPLLQKDMVDRCRAHGKPVIIATQMLHSMVESSTPTRAEVSDVANAVLDGADAVMLSAESAMGRYPVPAVEMMARIIAHAQAYRSEAGERRGSLVAGRLRVGLERDRTTSAVARSTVIVAQDIRARVIGVWARTGRTARWISKYQPSQNVIVIADRPQVCRRCALSWGLRAMLVPESFVEQGVSWQELERRLVEAAGLSDGDTVVLVGDPAAPMRVPTISIRVVDTAAGRTS